MHIKTISERLVALLKEKKFLQAQQELFHEDIISIEPSFHPANRTEGLSEVLKKEKAFLRNVGEWEKFEVSDPIVSESYFCIQMHFKFSTHSGNQFEINEIIMYEVENKKIVSEQFFYNAPQN